MHNVLLVSKSEISRLIKQYLRKEGYDSSAAEIQLLTEGAIVHMNETKIAQDAADVITRDPTLLDKVLAEIAESPKSIPQIVEATHLDENLVSKVLEYAYGKYAEVVSAVRHEGETYACWMQCGTETYDEYVKNEEKRILDRVEELSSVVCDVLPPFYSYGMPLSEAVEEICDTMDYDDAEDFRRDSKVVFHAMSERGVIEHGNGRWRVTKIEEDDSLVRNVQQAIYQTLRAGPRTETDVVNHLPKTDTPLPPDLDPDLVAYAIRMMSDVEDHEGYLVLNT